MAVVDTQNRNDSKCKNYILNSLGNTLFNLYSLIKSAKSLWKALYKKHTTKYVSVKKFIVGNFLDFKMVDSRTKINHVQDSQLILHDIHAERMVLIEFFQVTTIIKKFPPSQKNLKSYLEHKRKKIGMVDFILRFRIKQNNKFSKKRANTFFITHK